jgi:membrane dipeptidase
MRRIALVLAATLGACAHVPEDPRAVHEALLTLDTHLDTPVALMRPSWDIMQRHSVGEDMSQVDLPRMVEGGLDGGFFAIYIGQGPRTPEGNAMAFDAAWKRGEAIRKMVADHPLEFALALKADDAAPIAAAGKRVVFMSIENAYPLGDNIANLARFQQIGVRMLGLVHFTNNDIADSATDPKGPEWNGLSPFGRQVVAEANRLGLVLDQSHASDAVFDELLTLSATPIVLSHSGCRAVYDNPRNIDDERLRRLAAAGGVIQLNSLGDYLTKLPEMPERAAALKTLREEFGPLDALTPERREAFRAAYIDINRRYPVPQASIDDLMKHLLHALEVAGVDHVGIGLDWDGGGGVAGMNDVAGIPEITARLLAAGYSKDDLAKIWSGNVLRVLRAAEGYAKSAAANSTPR